MNNKRATKRALLTSVMALVMCVVMLVGTTFAWFTDTASTGVNKIVAGNLDVDIVGANVDATGKYPSLTGEGHKLNFTKAAVTDAEAGAEILWEPGCRYLTEGFRIANMGNLALKWKAEINKDNIVNGKVVDTAKDGKSLLDVIDFYVVTSKEENAEAVAIEDFTGNLKKDETSDVYYIKGVMKTSAGNDYQNLTLDGITITVYATQLNSEVDSFGPDYDKFADYPEVQPVATLEQLQEVLTSDDINGKTIKLYDNLDNVTNLRISNKDIALDLNGKSMKTEHLQVNGSKIVIKDTSEGGNGKIETTDSYAVVQAENSDVTIESGKFISRYNKDGGSGYAPVIQVRNSELTINGGYFENTNDVGSYNYLIKAPSNSKTDKTTITINGGEFVSHRNYGYIVTGDSDANVDVVINGGTFTTEGNNSYLTNVKGNVVVNDCTFTAGNSVVFNIPKGYTATVKGGTFSVNNKSGFFSHNKTTGWVSDFTGTLLVDPIKPVKINQETYSGFFANGATQSAKGADGFYTISK